MNGLDFGAQLSDLFGNVHYASVRRFRFAARRLFAAAGVGYQLNADGTFTVYHAWDIITVGRNDDGSTFYTYSLDN